MAIYFALVVILFISCSRLTSVDSVDPKDFLRRFGYMSEDVSSSSSFTDALKAFQDFHQLPVSGKLERRTRSVMNSRRCGVKDIDGYALVSMWKKYSLTYKITEYTQDMRRGDIDRVIASAFKIWSDVTPLTFTQVHPQANADMVVRFTSGHHGDPYPFDGKHGVLGHAMYPTSGQIHFDDEETFSEKFTYDEVNLFFCAAHEIGHSLGMRHLNDSTALMYPSYWAVKGPFKLPAPDVQEIQQAYGDENTIPTQPTTTVQLTTTQTTTKKPCLDSLPNCQQYKDRGECNRSRAHMEYWCPKLCGFCV